MELIQKLTKVLIDSKVPFSSDGGYFELHIGNLPVCIQIEDEDFVQYFIKEGEYDLFNDTFFSAEIIKEEDLEDIINTLKEVNKDLSKRIRKIKSLLGEIKELIDADESITTSFVSELWDEITD
jgi:hypothetical protein